MAQGCLSCYSGESEHSESAVGDLLECQLFGGLRGLGKVKGVESKVTGGTAGPIEHLEDGNRGDDLCYADPEVQLEHGARLESSIVRLHGGHSVHIPGEVDSQVGGDPANDGQHTDAAVLELSLPQPGDGHSVRDSRGI